MSVKVKNSKGRTVTLLNPSERSQKFAAELKYGVRLRNDGKIAVGPDGDVIGLTKEQLAYRAGVLDERRQSARIYRKQHPRYKRKNSEAVVKKPSATSIKKSGGKKK